MSSKRHGLSRQSLERSYGPGSELEPWDVHDPAAAGAFFGNIFRNNQAESRFRPLARRAAITLRPPTVAILARNPCRRLRTSLLG